jgi:dTDP-4-amino-4,6-dideoxygalactose transaminase
MNIPLVDLAAQLAEVADEVRAGLDEVLASTAFVGGPQVAAFEEAYAEFVGARHCVGVANGTDALEMAFRAVGVRPGNEVVLPANTFIATAEAVARVGAAPVFVDVEPDTLLMDTKLLPDALTPRTRAVVPVHLFGQAAAVEEVMACVSKENVAVVEDAAQSQGATRHGRAAGSLSTVAATSFYPGKNLGAAGDAGAVTTDDDDIARRVRLLGAHGSERKYDHEVLGFNSRLDTLQAVVLTAKLRRLAKWNEQRRAAAERYATLLSGLADVLQPMTAAGNEHVWHLYVVRVPDRDRVLRHLQENGIGAGIHYPVPVHLSGAFAHLGLEKGAFPVAEQAADEILSLPLYPQITPGQQERVVEVLADALR